MENQVSEKSNLNERKDLQEKRSKQTTDNLNIALTYHAELNNLLQVLRTFHQITLNLIRLSSVLTSALRFSLQNSKILSLKVTLKEQLEYENVNILVIKLETF